MLVITHRAKLFLFSSRQTPLTRRSLHTMSSVKDTKGHPESSHIPASCSTAFFVKQPDSAFECNNDRPAAVLSRGQTSCGCSPKRRAIPNPANLRGPTLLFVVGHMSHKFHGGVAFSAKVPAFPFKLANFLGSDCHLGRMIF